VTVEWLAESRDGGMLAGRVGRDGDRVVADWPGRARLTATRDGRDVIFEPSPDARPADVEKLRQGAARLLVTHLRGGIPLHASAVSLDGRAVVFIGAAGFGKSTLAATLGEHAGASLLGDDAVAIERAGDLYEVVALRESHWLDAAAAGALGRPTDASGEKAPHAPRRGDVERSPLAMIAHLSFSETIDAPRLVAVSGIEAVSGLLAQLTRFLVDDPAIARRDLAALADLVDHTRIVRLERPRSLDQLRATADLIAANVAAGSRGSP
jgi:hypothetical protein